MRALAEYAMRGRFQAVAVATICAAVPMFFWISAAIVALVTLRKGVTEGMALLLWASLPALAWLVMGSDPTPTIVIVGCAGLAVVLRATASWAMTLLAGVALGWLASWLVPLLLPELLAEIIQASQLMLDKMVAELAQQSGEQLALWLKAIFTGVLGCMHLMAMLGCLVVGRWWQATLYNPGGFREEFHSIILPRGMALIMMLSILFGGALSPAFLEWVPSLTVPFFVAGLALVHGIIGIKKLSGQWLIGFYTMFFFMGPYLYMLLIVAALLDSMLNLRQRISGQVNE